MDMFGSNESLQTDGLAQVKVIGVGGGGCNAVNRMYRERVPGVEYMAVNTDAQHLLRLDVPVKIRVGDKLTRGLGAGCGDSAEQSGGLHRASVGASAVLRCFAPGEPGPSSPGYRLPPRAWLRKPPSGDGGSFR